MQPFSRGRGCHPSGKAHTSSISRFSHAALPEWDVFRDNATLFSANERFSCPFKPGSQTHFSLRKPVFSTRHSREKCDTKSVVNRRPQGVERGKSSEKRSLPRPVNGDSAHPRSVEEPRMNLKSGHGCQGIDSNSDPRRKMSQWGVIRARQTSDGQERLFEVEDLGALKWVWRMKNPAGEQSPSIFGIKEVAFGQKVLESTRLGRRNGASWPTGNPALGRA